MVILYFVFGVALQEGKRVSHMSPGCCQTAVLGLGGLLYPKIFGSKKNLVPKKFLSQKYFGPKKIGQKKNDGSKKI